MIPTLIFDGFLEGFGAFGLSAFGGCGVGATVFGFRAVYTCAPGAFSVEGRDPLQICCFRGLTVLSSLVPCFD